MFGVGRIFGLQQLEEIVALGVNTHHPAVECRQPQRLEDLGVAGHEPLVAVDHEHFEGRVAGRDQGWDFRRPIGVPRSDPGVQAVVHHHLWIGERATLGHRLLNRLGLGRDGEVDEASDPAERRRAAAAREVVGADRTAER